ncbi:unnamed protein product, partial [Musa hybrid cultivar]
MIPAPAPPPPPPPLVSYYCRIPLTARILDLPRCHWRRQSKG